MPSLLPPSLPVSQAGRAAHDLGLAGLLGGTLFGRLALHPSVTAISDPRERGKVVNAAWRRYGVVNALGLAALVGGWAGARAAEARDRELAPASGAWRGRRTRSSARRGRGRRVGGRGHPLLAHRARRRRAAPRRRPRRRRRVARRRRAQAAANVLGVVTLAAEAALVVVNAALAQERFRRPPARRRAPWSRT